VGWRGRVRISLGGEQALKTSLPPGRRPSAPISPMAASTHLRAQGRLAAQPVRTTATDPQGHRYAISYQVRRFDGAIPAAAGVRHGARVAFAPCWNIGLQPGADVLPDHADRPDPGAFRQVAAGDLKVRLGPAWLRRRDEIADMAADFDRWRRGWRSSSSSRDGCWRICPMNCRSPLARLHLAIDLARQSPEKTDQSCNGSGAKPTGSMDGGELLALSNLEHGIAPPANISSFPNHGIVVMMPV